MNELLTNLIETVFALAMSVLIFVGFAHEPTTHNTQPTTHSQQQTEDKQQKTDDKTIVTNDETTPPPLISNPPPIEKETEKLQETIEAPPIISTISPTFLNERTRASVVNIFCLSQVGGFFRPISGSGVIIDEKGVILTNAHVAQYLLIKDYRQENFFNCVIRTGSPAKNRYRAELLYLSPDWVATNATNILKDNPVATGEEDYALLYITEAVDQGASRPTSFTATSPFVENTITIDTDLPVLTAGYPAGFLGGIATNRDLWLSSSFTTINQLFTFKEGGIKTIDLFSVDGVIGAQEGSSGGAVVSTANGQLLGIIVTRSAGDTTGQRLLQALTISHIDESLRRQHGEGLATLLAGDVESKVTDFASTTAPILRQQLINVLDR